jgi:hypothetical protein
MNDLYQHAHKASIAGQIIAKLTKDGIILGVRKTVGFFLSNIQWTMDSNEPESAGSST